MSSDDIASVAAAAVTIFGEKREVRKRRFWVGPSLRSRSIYGAKDLLNDLRMDDIDPITKEVTVGGYLKKFTRISCEDFEMLCNAIGPMVMKNDTRFREAISVTERLAVTLRFLATGDSYKSLSYLLKISSTTISRTIPKVCKALIKVLDDELKVSYLINMCI